MRFHIFRRPVEKTLNLTLFVGWLKDYLVGQGGRCGQQNKVISTSAVDKLVPILHLKDTKYVSAD